jgi:hypothetical protein
MRPAKDVNQLLTLDDLKTNDRAITNDRGSVLGFSGSVANGRDIHAAKLVPASSTAKPKPKEDDDLLDDEDWDDEDFSEPAKDHSVHSQVPAAYEFSFDHDDNHASVASSDEEVVVRGSKAIAQVAAPQPLAPSVTLSAKEKQSTLDEDWDLEDSFDENPADTAARPKTPVDGFSDPEEDDDDVEDDVEEHGEHEQEEDAAEEEDEDEFSFDDTPKPQPAKPVEALKPASRPNPASNSQSWIPSDNDSNESGSDFDSISDMPGGSSADKPQGAPTPAVAKTPQENALKSSAPIDPRVAEAQKWDLLAAQRKAGKLNALGPGNSAAQVQQEDEKKKQEQAVAAQLAEEKKKQEQAVAAQLAEEKKKQEQAVAAQLAEEKKKQEQAVAAQLAEEKKKQEQARRQHEEDERKRQEQTRAAQAEIEEIKSKLALEQARKESDLKSQLAAERAKMQQELDAKLEESRRLEHQRVEDEQRRIDDEKTALMQAMKKLDHDRMLQKQELDILRAAQKQAEESRTDERSPQMHEEISSHHPV